MSAKRMTRRRFLTLAGASAGATIGATTLPSPLIERALAVSPAGSSLRDIQHIVMLMQENRSFDHYFGTMSGVRGFADGTSYRSYGGGPSTKPTSVFSQSTIDNGNPLLSVGGNSYLRPFELVDDPPTANGQTLNDITHDWGPQHRMWADGAMDQFVVQHLLNDGTAELQFSTGTGGVVEPGSSTAPIGIETMGYYRPGDSLEFYRAVASAFTICDGYHCSVIGPTDPNRLMWMSGSLGAHSGDIGGPVLETYVTNREEMLGTLQWPTVPELLTEHGVAWKVYQDPASNALFNVLGYFQSFAEPTTPTQAQNAALGLGPVYPAEFVSDVVAGTLPQVSWIMPPVANCEHPATPPEYGEYLVSQILQTLVLNPEVWASTVFLVLYDENGGFFDHMAPPTPGPTVTTVANLPSGAEPGGPLDGEYVMTADPTNAAGGAPADWDDILGPVGLGFRVPGPRYLTLQRWRLGLPRHVRPHLHPQAHRERVSDARGACRGRRPARVDVAIQPRRRHVEHAADARVPGYVAAVAAINHHGGSDSRGRERPARIRWHRRLRSRLPGAHPERPGPCPGRPGTYEGHNLCQ